MGNGAQPAESAATVETVLYEVEGPLAWITLNRPKKLNAISKPVVVGLWDALARAEADDEVKLVVLRGAGGNFSAGYDLSEEVESELDSVLDWRELLEADVGITMRVWRFPKPTLAAVEGYCLAGACELAIACDMVLCDENAVFGEPEIRYGSGPVTLLLPFVLGQKKTSELLFTGDTIPAQEAARVGLVNAVAPSGELEREVQRLAARIVPTPLAVLRLTKEALVRAYEAKGLRQAVAANLDLSAILNAADTPEQREFDRIAREVGLRAALDWRDARYGPGDEKEEPSPTS
jgi:enoyl-CoA hydratase